MKVFDKIDFLFLKFFGFIGLTKWYNSHETFKVFLRYTFIMFLGFMVNTPLIFLFLDVFKWHWFISMSLAAFIVHLAKFSINKVWVFD